MKIPPAVFFKILTEDNPSLAHFSNNWEREDEFYYLKELNLDFNVLAVSDMSSIQIPDKQERVQPQAFGNVFPSVWSQKYDGGRQRYTSFLVHKKEDYRTSEFRKPILGGILSVISEQKPLNYSKAHVGSPHNIKK